MKGFWPVFKRELFSQFVTPTAWVLVVVFLAIQGVHFYLLVLHFAQNAELSVDQGPVQAFFGGAILFYLPLILLCPGMTMRLFAEERRSGTIESLLTAPVSTPGLVLGKFAAAFVTYVAMWLPTVLYIVVLRGAGEIDWHVVATSYLGVLLIGAGYLAVGTLMSAMTESQLVAILLSSLVILGLFVLGIGEFIFEAGPAHDFCAYVSVWGQMGELSKGIVDLRRLVIDATFIVLPLFVTVRAVDAWRWG
ncbi:MAG TPA: ABC transporter permease [Polyangiaceae bacterium]|nr:ABC transporter permease [Polyangiaceae bacterium]